MRRHILALAVLGIVLPLPSFAQSFGASQTPFTISASPQYPLPHSSVTLSFLSSSLDLANATLSVTANGKTIYAGAVHSVTVPVGNAGSVTNIAATVTTGGANYTQTLVLQPEDVVLVAEPIASAPVLYPGKPGVPLEGTVRVVAIANFRTPSGALVAPASLSYAWNVDDTQIADSSGIGKSALIVVSPLEFRSRTISVSITSPDGSLVGGSSVVLSAVEPSLRIYENDPLLGVRYEHALGDTYSLSGAEDNFLAVPYSFPTTSGNPFISWFVNGSAAQTGSSVTLRPTGTGSGQASLSAVASSGDLKASRNVTLLFGQSSSPNFFGL